jgi:hypothetical protein
MFGAKGDDSFGLSTAAWAGTLSRNTERKNFFAEDFIFASATIYGTYGMGVCRELKIEDDATGRRYF